MWDRWALPVHQVVIVNLRGEANAVRGVLWRVRCGWLTLKKAELLATGPPTPIDGEVLVHRDRIDFVQVPPPAA